MIQLSTVNFRSFEMFKLGTMWHLISGGLSNHNETHMQSHPLCLLLFHLHKAEVEHSNSQARRFYKRSDSSTGEFEKYA